MWKDIKYFNNQIICDMIDSNRAGILGMLDECAFTVACACACVCLCVGCWLLASRCWGVASLHGACTYEPRRAYAYTRPPRGLAVGGSVFCCIVYLPFFVANTILLISTAHIFFAACRLMNQTDMTLLHTLDKTLGSHDRYDSKQTDSKNKDLRRDIDFKIKHFAGDVTYNIDGFLDKNKVA